MALQPPPGPQRASSTSSSSASTFDSRASSSSSSHGAATSPKETRSSTASSDAHTPQPGQFLQHTQQPFLPTMTSSPPPHTPAYVPPPQHAMAPDPIHGVSQPAQPFTAWSGTAPGQWRPGPSTFPTQPRSLPNGHDTYATRSTSSTSAPQAMFPGLTRPGSAHGDSRGTRSRERSVGGDTERDSREDEVISTIFVVGFPDDMLVSISCSRARD